MSPDQRIVITGLGVVSPLGCDPDTFHRSLAAGRSGISPLNFPWGTGYQANQAGLVKTFEISEFMDSAGLDHLGRTSQFALVAGKMALEQAGLEANDPSPQVGLVVGTALAEALQREQIWETHHAHKQLDSNGHRNRPVFPPQHINDHVAGALRLEGPSHLVTTTCAAGNHALAWAADLLKSGAAEAMLAIGADTIGYVDLLGFCRLYLQTPDRIRPFDLHRKGMLHAEGAGAILLEPLSLARRRGVTILAELAGCGLSCDATGPFTGKIRDIDSLLLAARRALSEARCKPEEIDYISAHGTGTRLNDAKETYFIKMLLGQRARQVAVSSIKSMLGHAQGAASTFEAIAAVLSFQHNLLYPTINYQTPDPQCDLDYIPNQAREGQVGTIMSNAFGVGGNNAIVILKRWRGS